MIPKAAAFRSDVIRRTNGRRFELTASQIAHEYTMAPNGLSRPEYETLLDMINRRFRIATTVLISGTKRRSNRIGCGNLRRCLV